MRFVEVNAADSKDDRQVAFNQQTNNRYLMTLDRERPGGNQQNDLLAMQREGTNFALTDEGYGERTCIISEGLGTIRLEFKGKSYWVCCTGCQAAFEADPELWLAKAAEREKAKQ
jgi:hypothetical protein